MKTTNGNFSFLTIMTLSAGLVILGSCSKSSTSTPAPTPLGGYVSSDSVAAANLIAYWPFDGNANDTKGGMTATIVGNPTYTSGVRGQSYQGTVGAYATYTPSAAFSSLQSYSVSVWYKLPTSDPSYSSTKGQDTLTQGMLFLYGTDNWLLVNEIEPFHGDSVKVHAGFQDFASPAYQGFVPETFDTMAVGKWVNFIVTYNGGTSTYTTYQDGVPTGANTAFSPAPPANAPNNPFPGAYNTPNPLYTDGTMGTPLGNLGWGTHTPSSIIVGSWPDGLFGQVAAVNTFRGQMDELRVYNKALTQAEVVGLYLNGQAGR